MNLRLRAVLPCGFVLACLTLLIAGEGVLLVPRFAAGERVRYRMTLKVETESTLNPLEAAGTSSEPLRLAFDITWQLEALEVEPSGAVRLRAVIEALQMESSLPAAPPAAAEEFVGKAVSYRLLSDGKVDSIEAPAEWLDEGQAASWVETWLEQGSAFSSGLPPKPVQVGESWRSEREFDVPGLPHQRLTAESTYLRDERVGEAPCASVLTRFELGGRETREDKTGESTRLVVENRVEGGGQRLSCYDHRTGRLLESTQSSRESVRLEFRLPAERAAEARPALVLVSQTTTESHLRVVE